MKPFGIIVYGYRRKKQLSCVLESLERQGVLDVTHVWIDGYSHAQEAGDQVIACQGLRQDFPQAHWQIGGGRLGIEKLMLDGLTFMARYYEKIIVLEDDCFPTYNAVKVFLDQLAEIENDPAIYSVYGHHFLTPNEGPTFSRFQGWGWATTRNKLLPVLSQLKAMFIMPEADYLSWIDSALTPEIIAKLDVTPGRDVVKTLRRQFSWDSATALLSAIQGLSHRKTPERVIYNCGVGLDSGHFRVDSEFCRKPPLNMIGVDEVWQYFNGPLAAPYQGRKYFGLNELDRKISEYVTQESGVFVELGAYDGINQSNTLYFERKGWRGLLIEPVLETYHKCCLNRPLARVVHAACVAFDYQDNEIDVVNVGLMSLVEGARNNEQEKQEWIRRGEQVQKISHRQCRAPARTLSDILEKEKLGVIDLFSLDVEGYEAQVLNGMDFSRFRPIHIVIEDSGTMDIESYFTKVGYKLIAVLEQREFTRDLLFRDARLLAL